MCEMFFRHPASGRRGGGQLESGSPQVIVLPAISKLFALFAPTRLGCVKAVVLGAKIASNGSHAGRASGDTNEMAHR